MLHAKALKFFGLQKRPNPRMLRLAQKWLEIDRFVRTVIKVNVQLVVRLVLRCLH